MLNANHEKQQVIDSTGGPEVDKLVWNHLYHSLEILLKESINSTYGNNRANAYMLQRQLTAVDKHYQKTYGEYPRTGEKIPSPVHKPNHSFLEQRSRAYQKQQARAYNTVPKKYRNKSVAILNAFKNHTDWHQKDIAKFLGINQASVSTWNTGKANMPEKHEKKLIEILRSKVPEFKERYDQYQEGYMKRASNF
jgi:DNA-binding transcriptional regulator YiaG